jgi:hypothetical protein
MITPGTSAAHAQAAAQSTAMRPKPPQPKPTRSATDTVNLSSAKAIVQESLETSAQTTKEAASGDIRPGIFWRDRLLPKLIPSNLFDEHIFATNLINFGT